MADTSTTTDEYTGVISVDSSKASFRNRLGQFSSRYAVVGVWIALAGLNIAFFLLAAVMDEIAIMVILGPMLIALGNKFGVDPIFFGDPKTAAMKVLGLV